MQILLRCVGSAVVVGLIGRLTATTNVSALYRLCGQLNRSPGTTIIVDLSKVERLDCTGIGELVNLHKCAECAGSEMRIVNVGRFHRELLEMFQLIEPLNVCSTWRAALRGCTRRPSGVGDKRLPWPMTGSPGSRAVGVPGRGGRR